MQYSPNSLIRNPGFKVFLNKPISVSSVLYISFLKVWFCQELQQTKSAAASNRTSDLPDSGRPYEPKGYNV
ncbi:hypothetical protein BB560_006501, partial [Smittium megazygosporum]